MAAVAGEPDASVADEQQASSEQPAADVPRPALVVAVAGETAEADAEAGGSTIPADPNGTDTSGSTESTVGAATTTPGASATTTAPGTQAPTTQVASTLAPSTLAPATQAPTMGPPATQPPTTQSATTQPPTTQPPATQPSGIDTRDVVSVLALPTFGGGSFDPATLKGKPVLVWFWGPF